MDETTLMLTTAGRAAEPLTDGRTFEACAQYGGSRARGEWRTTTGRARHG